MNDAQVLKLQKALEHLHGLWMEAEKAAYRAGTEGTYEAGFSKGMETAVETLMTAISEQETK